MEDESTGPVDVPALETIQAMADRHDLVETAVLTDDAGGRMGLVVSLDERQYPPDVPGARLRITWFENDDYSFHYREEWDDGTAWQCRWDSHPHGHDTARTHFHEPPNAAADPVTDHVDEVTAYALFTRTMATVRERIESLWANG